MIETKDQFLRAYKEIRRITGWKDGKIAKRAGIHRSTLYRIRTIPERMPDDTVMERMNEALIYARGLKQQ